MLTNKFKKCLVCIKTQVAKDKLFCDRCLKRPVELRMSAYLEAEKLKRENNQNEKGR